MTHPRWPQLGLAVTVRPAKRRTRNPTRPPSSAVVGAPLWLHRLPSGGAGDVDTCKVGGGPGGCVLKGVAVPGRVCTLCLLSVRSSPTLPLRQNLFSVCLTAAREGLPLGAQADKLTPRVLYAYRSGAV